MVGARVIGDSTGGLMTEDRTGDPPPDSTYMAELRTFLAAERTLFAFLRTGLAIAGGGSLVITLLGDAWPYWFQVPLVAVFLAVGYGIALAGLRRYRSVAVELERRKGPQHPRTISHRTIAVATVALQIAITIVVILFLLEAFQPTG